MSLYQTTPTPNELFEHLPTLTDPELRVLLLVIRQTFGWIHPQTKQRKLKDMMTYNFILKKTGLYRTCLSSTIQHLINKQLINVSDVQGNLMDTPSKRKGKRCLYYEYVRTQPIRNCDTTSSQSRTTPIRNYEHNKRNTLQKKNIQKKTNAENIKRLQQMQQSLVKHVGIDFD